MLAGLLGHSKAMVKLIVYINAKVSQEGGRALLAWLVVMLVSPQRPITWCGTWRLCCGFLLGCFELPRNSGALNAHFK